MFLTYNNVGSDSIDHAFVLPVFQIIAFDELKTDYKNPIDQCNTLNPVSERFLERWRVMHAFLFLLFYLNTVLLIDEIICSECCFPTLTLLWFDFSDLHFVSYFLNICFLPFFSDWLKDS